MKLENNGTYVAYNLELEYDASRGGYYYVTEDGYLGINVILKTNSKEEKVFSLHEINNSSNYVNFSGSGVQDFASRPGKAADSYNVYKNYNEFIIASNLTDNPQIGDNPGDIPAPFILTKSGTIAKDTEFKVGENSIKILAQTYNLKWDSKTGMVSGTTQAHSTSKRVAIPTTGKTLGEIPIGGIKPGDISINSAILEYDYWYY